METETLAGLLIKVHNGEMTMDEATTYAAENITPIKTHYDEDGVWFRPRIKENVPNLLDLGVLLKDYTVYELHEFRDEYFRKRELLNKTDWLE